MTLTEASRPDIKNVATRKKLANNLNQARKNIVNTKDTKTKEKLKNIAKYDATTYGAGKQNENNSSVVSKKNNEQMNLNSKRPDLDLLSKKNFIRMNEGETMTFESRLLQEDAYNPGGGFDNHMKKNWGKYATGAGLGALATGAAHVMGGTDMLDDAKELYQNDELGNTVIDKVQGGLDYLKNDDNHANFASGHNSNDYSNGSGDFKNGSVFKPKFDKLTDVVSGNSSDSSGSMNSADSGSASSGPMSAVTAAPAALTNDQRITLANAPFANKEGEGTRTPFFGPERANHLFDWKGDVNTTPNTDEMQAVKNQMISDNYDTRWNTYQDKKEALDAATEKMREGSGKISKEEMTALKNAMNANPGEAPTMDSAPSISDKAIQGKLNADLENSVAYAKTHGLQNLLNGNTSDDLTLFNKLAAQPGGIPQELQPIYNEVMRKAQS